ncbi:MAG: hypothetical protein KF900_10125 [Bacteroidetes bacterium]|nr:hypothetical protein [Bacteroidota bacterium]
MKNLLIKYLNAVVLEQLSKAELIKKVIELQQRDEMLMNKLTDCYVSQSKTQERHREDISFYKKQINRLIKQSSDVAVEREYYKRIADLKLGNTYNLNATWIDKIVFVLNAADRPLRSSEIIEILRNNDMKFDVMTNHQKCLSFHLNKAMKYGRIVGTKQIGQNGYVFELPK